MTVILDPRPDCKLASPSHHLCGSAHQQVSRDQELAAEVASDTASERQKQHLLGGDFGPDDTSWPAICAHAAEVARWLLDLRARRARAKAAGSDEAESVTAPVIHDAALEPAEIIQ